MSDVTTTPEEVDLQRFFGGEPKQAEPQDGYWMYEASDSARVTLRFSFNLHERSVQTSLDVAGANAATISHECARAIRIDAATDELVAEFDDGDSRTELRICLRERIRVIWATLAIT